MVEFICILIQSRKLKVLRNINVCVQKNCVNKCVESTKRRFLFYSSEMLVRRHLVKINDISLVWATNKSNLTFCLTLPFFTQSHLRPLSLTHTLSLSLSLSLTHTPHIPHTHTHTQTHFSLFLPLAISFSTHLFGFVSFSISIP